MKLLSQISLVIVFAFSAFAQAADIEWSGLYRVEGFSQNKPDLTNGDRGLDYGLQHLILRPKIVASDGFTIRSQFDVFNNSSYPNTHLGQYWGTGPRDRSGVAQNSTHTADQSNTFSTAGAGGTISVSQLYFTWDHEFGSLIVGRAPLQFGLGMTYSAGMGMFDHFYNTLDMVGYKLVFGNIFVEPMIGKSSSGAINRNDDVRDYLIQAQYDSPEDGIELGVMYHLRQTNDQGSDGPLTDGANPSGSILGTGSPTFTSASIQNINVYALKDTSLWHLGAEFGLQSGKAGVQNTGDDHVTMSGFGLALEAEYHPDDSNWKWGLKAGYATGDDPSSTGSYEGYIFNRNYDVAFLLFNHPLGSYDVFRTRMIGGGGGQPNYNGANPGSHEIAGPDIDAISNVLYLAPYGIWKMNDRWNMKGVLATGMLNVDPSGVGAGKAVGYEFDYSINFTPRKGIAWLNEVGVLAPGSAFKGGSNNFGTGVTYGFQTRAAISF